MTTAPNMRSGEVKAELSSTAPLRQLRLIGDAWRVPPAQWLGRPFPHCANCANCATATAGAVDPGATVVLTDTGSLPIVRVYLMPMKPRRYCAEAGCTNRVAGGRCRLHAAQHERERPNASIRHLYHTPRWEALKAQVRREQPLCPLCEADGRTVAGTQTDHVRPHRGDEALFFDIANLQNLCDVHHAMKTRAGL